jgi:hypothetical protein
VLKLFNLASVWGTANSVLRVSSNANVILKEITTTFGVPEDIQELYKNLKIIEELCRKEVDGSVVSLHQILKKNLLRQI